MLPSWGNSPYSLANRLAGPIIRKIGFQNALPDGSTVGEYLVKDGFPELNAYIKRLYKRNPTLYKQLLQTPIKYDNTLAGIGSASFDPNPLYGKIYIGGFRSQKGINAALPHELEHAVQENLQNFHTFDLNSNTFKYTGIDPLKYYSYVMNPYHNYHVFSTYTGKGSTRELLSNMSSAKYIIPENASIEDIIKIVTDPKNVLTRTSDIYEALRSGVVSDKDKFIKYLMTTATGVTPLVFINR